MSTSIAANVGPRSAVPDTHLSPPPAHQAQEEAKSANTVPPEGLAFTSPVIKVDNGTGLALLVVRDSSTGEELDQYPSKKAVAEYQRVQGGAPESSGSGSSSGPGSSSDKGQALAADAVAPPAPVAAPPVSLATGDARTTASVSSSAGVKPVSL